jgi:hypothetical protein
MKKLLLSGIAALLLATGTAHTESNVLGCFTRTYDKAHLAKHPDQLVTAIRLRVYHPPSDVSATWMGLEAKVRGRNVVLSTTGNCRKSEPSNPRDFKHLPPRGALWCSVECDGGGVSIAPRDGHAMMYLGGGFHGGIRVSVKGVSCGEPEEEVLSANKDDDIFRLNRVDERACAGIEP